MTSRIMPCGERIDGDVTDAMDHYRSCKWPACKQKLQAWEELDAMLRSPQFLCEQVAAARYGIWIDFPGTEGRWLTHGRSPVEFSTEADARKRITFLPFECSYSVRVL